MVIPDNVKIGYKDYKVTMVDGHVIDDNKVCYGCIEYNDSNINISKQYSIDQQKCTFLHECIHGIDDVVEIGLDEDQVRQLAKGLYQFIKDNPEIFKQGGE